MRAALIVGLAAAGAVALFLLPPMPQDPAYHQFFDNRARWGIPNFWNVASNLGFLLVAAWGVRALRSRAPFLEAWERTAYVILLVGLAMVAAGSSYYHASPDNATLVWDRLPMAIVFMSLLAATIGERISARAGRLLLFPLLAIGLASVLYWSYSNDLRLYVVVQFFPVVALPLMILLFRPRYSGTPGIVAMIALYSLAKGFELLDRQIGEILATGGHPWKHIAGAAAMLCYVDTIRRRVGYKG